MGLLGSILGVGSDIAAFVGAGKKNNMAAQQYADQQKYAGQQNSIAALIQSAAAAQAGKGSTVTDPYGGGTYYDPATGTWRTSLGGAQSVNQGASDNEENARLTADQAIRRQGLVQAEQLRQGAAGRADAAGRTYDRMGQGIGLVDPSQVASSLRLSRTSAVNAGYDDAMHAAGTMSLRTGTSAGDTYATLARKRANDVATGLGNPDLDAIQYAEQINEPRKAAALGSYGQLNQAGSNFYDANYTPVNYAQQATDNAFKAQNLDLDRFNATSQANLGAGSLVGSAARGMLGAGQQQMANTEYNRTGKLISGVGNNLTSLAGGSSGVDSLLKKLGF